MKHYKMILTEQEAKEILKKRSIITEYEKKRMQKLAGIITENDFSYKSSENSSGKILQNYLAAVNPEKYYDIIDQNKDDVNSNDLVDFLYDDFFNNELKGKPGIIGKNWEEFQDNDRGENYSEPGDSERMIARKIYSIITDYLQ